MNIICLPHTLFRLGPVFLLLAFLLTGCGGSHTDLRSDDRMRTFTARDDIMAKTGTVSPHNRTTAHYIIRPGHRPDFEKMVVQPQQTGPSYEEQVAALPMVIEASDILFEFDKWVIRRSVVPELDRWVEFFKNNPQVKAEIFGHADSTGPTVYNQSLSEKRAIAVINYLAKNGVDPKRFVPRAFGETKPIAPNSTKEGRQKNRRVELNL